jgi:hypothetical protein
MHVLILSWALRIAVTTTLSRRYSLSGIGLGKRIMKLAILFVAGVEIGGLVALVSLSLPMRKEREGAPTGKTFLWGGVGYDYYE